MSAKIHMTKAEMRAGLIQGRRLIQEEWAHPDEIKWINELIAEGICTATDWEYHPNFQCSKRAINGIKQ